MIAENIQNIRENVKKTCFRVGRDPQSVELIAVSKTFSIDHIKEALNAGVTDFGENYVQELVEKKNALLGKPIHWHFIGHLQSNKVKYIADWIHLIHSVDSVTLAEEIHKRAVKFNRTIDVLVEVNTSAEATKFGVNPAKAIEVIKRVAAFTNIHLKGLMTIGPFTSVTSQSRAAFKLLKNIFDKANAENLLPQPMTVLSMGMTHDYEIAIEEGSTMIRIGTAIFGSRQKYKNLP